ncbi:MAG: T9SS C-terminal target domain-containing protein [Ignavibacteriales bacterium]|nr:MAG: T9SS C-terminal target domain-containing protein [Ignavibacteriales bacterium]
MNLKIIIVFAVLVLETINAQQIEWLVYDTTNSSLPDNQIHAIAVDENNIKWIGTAKGLVRIDGSNWEVFNTENSEIPSSAVHSLYADSKGVFVGTDSGLAKYYEGKWMLFDKEKTIFESQLIVDIIKDKENNYWVAGELNLIKIDGGTWEVLTNESAIGNYQSLVVDNNNHIWAGDFNHASFNGILWEYNGVKWNYSKLNDYPDLISSFPYALAVDSNNVVWMGTGGTPGGRLVKIENNNWQTYTSLNSDFPGGGINSILIEDSVKWIGSSKGLVSFNGKEWKVFNRGNSELPDDWVYTLAIDKYGNKWIGTISGGLTVYKENGIVTSNQGPDYSKPSEFQLFQNFPNPFNPRTTIQFGIPTEGKVTIKIFDIMGREVATLVNEHKAPGEYKVEFSAEGGSASGGNSSKLASGIYFYRLQAGDFISSRKLILLK